MAVWGLTVLIASAPRSGTVLGLMGILLFSPAIILFFLTEKVTAQRNVIPGRAAQMGAGR